MKKRIKQFILPVFIFAFMSISQISLADDPAPPPPGGDHGSGGNKAPLGGPITGGVVVFIAFAAGLTGWEVYKARKRKKEESV